MSPFGKKYNDYFPDCQHKPCDEGFWKCSKHHKCIALEKVCDGGHTDCSINFPTYLHEASDEEPEMCGNFTCPAGKIKCLDGKKCILVTNVCDYHRDCPDGDDEAGCEYSCSADEWTCIDRCIPLVQVCDGEPDCAAGEDKEEEMCKNHTCAQTMWKCLDGSKCIWHHTVCKGKYPHCHDGSDESPTFCKSHQCEADSVKCPDGVTCIRVGLLCQ